MREWAYALQYASSDARRQALPHWIHHYNEHRTHSALDNRPPAAAFVVAEQRGGRGPDPHRGS